MEWFDDDEILDEVPPPDVDSWILDDCGDCEELALDDENERCPFCSHFTACPECDD